MPRTRRALAALALFAALAWLTPAAQAGDTAITIDNFSFTPARVTVPAGTHVVWTNRDDIPHTVTSDDKPRTLKSSPLDTGDQYSMTFDKPGTYAYFCSLHPHMQGTVVVQ
ncbi:MAG: cupredoxin family copper-binding protein [Acidisphaera sp.]|nr:cupredoxin family copper-binding protein [Acidisphaera sp.]